MSFDEAFDYVIVGGGTAGVVIASRLSQHLPGSKIALLEAGPDAVNNPNVTNPQQLFSLAAEGLMVDYSTAPQPHLNGRVIPNVAGRMLSGSSGGNVGCWMRAASTDYDLIAKKVGNDRFSFEKLLPYLNKTENYWDKDADAAYHGFGGPLNTVGGRTYPLRQIVQESAEEIGHRKNDDFYKGDPTGITPFVQCFKATSESSSERQHSAYVYDLKEVDVRCDSPVSRILFDSNKRAVGVELLSGKKIHAAKEVIVSCGTQKTPQLLMLSGVGPSGELSKHNIPLVLDAPAVGQNLIDHQSLSIVFKLKDPTKGYALPFENTAKPEYGQGLPAEFVIWSHIPSSDLSPVLAKDGISPNQAEGEGEGGPDSHQQSQQPQPQPQQQQQPHAHLLPNRCHFMTVPVYLPLLTRPDLYPSVAPHAGTHITIFAVNLLPLSRGTVTLASASPSDHPVVDPNFLAAETDRFSFRRAVRDMLRLADAGPLARVLDGEAPPESCAALGAASADADIDERIAGYAATISHPMGTCALGEVLDAEFGVRGVTGLRVCDASVFPEPIGAMPSQTVYAMGELCADLVAGRA
ncbi:mitochondrial putative choline dehydrogenase [Corynespora cassiicola Philippines]|uniref:Mitochondrial putative choline dehydrogenase n=1 Tax=Corynespora cassiicola Philippines TaxID=1448308 RepID=A0A2T2P985_CORCC|nr:mitochondrial putative choline dehydrogenase [Corynespora cassiicola Philippines]